MGRTYLVVIKGAQLIYHGFCRRHLITAAINTVKTVNNPSTGILNSFLLTLVFISFAIFSSIIPKFFSKKTAQQSNNWSTSTGTYITFMSDSS